MIVFGNTDIGSVRKNNQDYFTNRVISDDLLFSIVCDGMGGENGGQIASKVATECIEETIDHELILNQSTPKQALVSAINNANAKVYSMAQEDSMLIGMGTTTVMVIICSNKLHCISAGDSRLYKFDRKTLNLTQLTKDHTVVQFLLQNGGITEEQAKNHPQKHGITRAIGAEAVIDIDYFEHELSPSDALLLCTDGLYNYMSQTELIKKLSDSIEIGSVRPLIDLANKNGGGDNITAVIIAAKQVGVIY